MERYPLCHGIKAKLVSQPSTLNPRPHRFLPSLQVVTGSHDSTIRTWDLRTGKTSCTLTYHKKAVRALAAHPSEHGGWRLTPWCARSRAEELHVHVRSHRAQIRSCRRHTSAATCVIPLQYGDLGHITDTHVPVF